METNNIININYLNNKSADELRQLIIEKEIEYQTFKAKIRTVVQRANQLRTENETLQQQVSVNSKLIESMEADILRQQQQIKTSNEEISKLNEKYRRDTQQLVSAIHQLKDKKALLEKQLASPRIAVHTKQSPSKGEDKTANEDVERLSKQIEKLTLERDKMKKLVQDLEKDSMGLRESQKEKELKYKAQIQKLKETVEELKKQNNLSGSVSYTVPPATPSNHTKDPYSLNHSNHIQKPVEDKKEFLDPALAFGLIQNVSLESTKKKRTHKGSTMKTPVSKSFDANSFVTPDKKNVSEQIEEKSPKISYFQII